MTVDKRLDDMERQWLVDGEIDFNDYGWIISALKSEREEKERLEMSIEQALREFDRGSRIEGLSILKNAIKEADRK